MIAVLPQAGQRHRNANGDAAAGAQSQDVSGCIIGGILLVIGLFTRGAALAVAIFMLNAVYFTSKTGGFFWTNRGSEFSILLLACAVFFLIRGGGAWSVDRHLGREL